MIDTITQIDAIHREVSRRGDDGGELVAVLLQRHYPSPVEDVWDAITDPERIKRWFLPLTGDLREGGDFQLEGNAGGRILRCDWPRLVRVTFGSDTSIVELRLIADGDDATILELEHTVPLEMAGSGAGALYVGPGWDGAFLALGLFLAGEVIDDPVAAASSPEAQAFSRASVAAWTTAIEHSGTAGPTTSPQQSRSRSRSSPPTRTTNSAQKGDRPRTRDFAPPVKRAAVHGRRSARRTVDRHLGQCPFEDGELIVVHRLGEQLGDAAQVHRDGR